MNHLHIQEICLDVVLHNNQKYEKIQVYKSQVMKNDKWGKTAPLVTKAAVMSLLCLLYIELKTIQ